MSLSLPSHPGEAAIFSAKESLMASHLANFGNFSQRTAKLSIFTCGTLCCFNATVILQIIRSN